jgi:hypothetical protein
MYILRALVFLFLTQAVVAQQPTPILPDPKLTPGDTFDVTAQDVCVPGYAKKVRAVPAWLKRQAYAEYVITQYKTGGYEVDHLIPLSLGGSNSIRNPVAPIDQNIALEFVCERCTRAEAPQARMRRPIGPPGRSARDSVQLD